MYGIPMPTTGVRCPVYKNLMVAGADMENKLGGSVLVAVRFQTYGVHVFTVTDAQSWGIEAMAEELRDWWNNRGILSPGELVYQDSDGTRGIYLTGYFMLREWQAVHAETPEVEAVYTWDANGLRLLCQWSAEGYRYPSVDDAGGDMDYEGDDDASQL
jgi:hypothetical protein